MNKTRLPSRYGKNEPAGLAGDSLSFKFVIFLAAHVLLGLAVRWSSLAATAQAFLALAAGLYFLSRDDQPNRLIFSMAYITGAETLWRAAGAHIFWETGKYSVILLGGLGLLKYARGSRPVMWPVAYFILLLPSLAVMPYFDREAIAFNLAGPLALAVACMFFSVVRLDQAALKRTLIMILAPTMSLGIFVLGKIASYQEITVGSSSNFQLSGDYGPNQVSVALALGALAGLYLVFHETRPFYRFLFLFVSVWLLAQSALTFSRTGVWITGGAVVVSGLYLLRSPRARLGFIAAVLAAGLAGYYLIVPFLNDFTGGRFSDRYSSLDTTGRLEIVQADWMVFQMYPLFGVGPNQSKPYHALTFRYSSSHVEYSRMLSEHGIFGLLALMLLLRAAAQRYFSSGDPYSKSFPLGLTAWALLFMLASGMRLVMPSFLFGLGAAAFVLRRQPDLSTRDVAVSGKLGTRLSQPHNRWTR